MAGLLRRHMLDGRSPPATQDSAFKADHAAATAPLDGKAGEDPAVPDAAQPVPAGPVHPALRSMSLPARHTQLTSSVPAADGRSGGDSQPLSTPKSLFTPLFSRRFTSLGGGDRVPASDYPPGPHSMSGSEPAYGSSGAHSAPIAIQTPRTHHDGNDADASPMSDATMVPASEGDNGSGSAASSPISKLALSTGTTQSEDFDQRFREWNDMVYSGSY